MSSGVRIAGLWNKKTPNGHDYLEGSIGGIIWRIYSNGYKKKDSDPDFILYVSQKPYDTPKPQRSAPKAFPGRQAEMPLPPQEARLNPPDRPYMAPSRPNVPNQAPQSSKFAKHLPKHLQEPPPQDDSPFPESEYADSSEPPF